MIGYDQNYPFERIVCDFGISAELERVGGVSILRGNGLPLRYDELGFARWVIERTGASIGGLLNKASGLVTTTSTVSNPYLKDPDVQLMLRVREDDGAAFAQIVAKYQDRLIGLLANLVGDRTTAEDIAQEVFLRVHRARHGYEANAKFSTWLFSIAHNLASNTRRAKGRRKETQLTSPDSSGPQASPQEQMVAEKSSLMPSRLMAKTELMEKVQAAMETLNERQRMALLLHKFEGMNYIDIGAAMEMTPQAVKSLLSRARDQLRVALEEYAK